MSKVEKMPSILPSPGMYCTSDSFFISYSDFFVGSFRDIESDMALEKVLATKGQQQQELIGNLLEDEKYQREAFRSLFMKEDSRHSELCMQVEQIQSQLASLTMVEMTKKELKVEFEKDVMREKRETLTQMLMSLMDQKEARQAELSARLNELEKHKSQETDNYWLIQYQKLLDAKPQGLLEAEKAIDPDLKDVLVKAGAEDYVPILAIKDVNKKQVMYMNDKQLSEVTLSFCPSPTKTWNASIIL